MANLMEEKPAGTGRVGVKPNLRCGWSGMMPHAPLTEGPAQAVALTQPFAAPVTHFGALESTDLPTLPASAFSGLYAQGYLNPAMRQNNSPTNEDWQALAERFDNGVWFEGYVVGGGRHDRRIAVEGIYVETALLAANPVLRVALERFDPDEIEQDFLTVDGVPVTRYWWD